MRTWPALRTRVSTIYWTLCITSILSPDSTNSLKSNGVSTSNGFPGYRTLEICVGSLPYHGTVRANLEPGRCENPTACSARRQALARDDFHIYTTSAEDVLSTCDSRTTAYHLCCGASTNHHTHKRFWPRPTTKVVPQHPQARRSRGQGTTRPQNHRLQRAPIRSPDLATAGPATQDSPCQSLRHQTILGENAPYSTSAAKTRLGFREQRSLSPSNTPRGHASWRCSGNQCAYCRRARSPTGVWHKAFRGLARICDTRSQGRHVPCGERCAYC
ncbi:hypothetical protein CB0940_00632 [Cercospora beticola]|uniref:Uncharacterized protein n=1 Tax=Cercospora beticola TaxID=122368 RepID=A0A2G5I7E5_CERBT|nr:hypothetical protein CB0940_00632 [Cercospora beticola]PIB00717.1 hypothetical protein CB0940_00632 [Cercospora beticola]